VSIAIGLLKAAERTAKLKQRDERERLLGLWAVSNSGRGATFQFSRLAAVAAHT